MDLKQDGNYRELLKCFQNNRVFCHMHPYEIYRKWLEAVWLFCESSREREKFQTGLDCYSGREGEEFGRLFGIYCLAVESMPFRDILGELFMELDVNSARNGQYFTPWHIADMMARMQFSREQFRDIIAAKGEVSVHDPCCGSGVMLLAFASVVYSETGEWGLGKLRLYGSDIDLRCVHMCRIQLRMNGLDSVGKILRLAA